MNIGIKMLMPGSAMYWYYTVHCTLFLATFRKTGMFEKKNRHKKSSLIIVSIKG